MTARKLRLLALALLACSLPLVGCDLFGGDDDDDDFDVDVSLVEFAVNTNQASAPAGAIVFHVRNDGTVVHEFVVVRSDLPVGGLPTNPDGSYDETAVGATLVDEVEDLDPGEEVDLVVDLAAGNYVLLCNRVVGVMSHYQAGMATGFTVD